MPARCWHFLRFLRECKMTTTLNLADFQDLLTCTLCSGFYRDAHTILECMHTFCKSCILKHFHHNNQRGSIQCPQCSVNLGLYGHLSSKMIYDGDVQAIVDKIFPQFAAEEKEAEESFYAAKNIPLKAGAKHELSSNVQELPPAKRAKVQASVPAHDLIAQSTTRAVQASKPHTATKGEAQKETPAEVEFVVRVVPDESVDESLKLGNLAKRLCKATKSVKFIKIKNFVHKRLPEADQAGLEAAGIRLSFNGKVITNAEDRLSSLGTPVEEAISKETTLELLYCREKPLSS